MTDHIVPDPPAQGNATPDAATPALRLAIPPTFPPIDTPEMRYAAEDPLDLSRWLTVDQVIDELDLRRQIALEACGTTAWGDALRVSPYLVLALKELLHDALCSSARDSAHLVEVSPAMVAGRR